jgi:3',5'-cyclic AMP phosphodiesterase CpdA
VVALVEERRPDFVVLSGDLTQRAKPHQFREARAFVERLACPTLAVPGNHDVPLYRLWERILAPFAAWRRNFSTELEPSFGDGEVQLVGVNTAFNWTATGGRIGARKRRRLVCRFALAPPSCYKIAVLHHGLLRPPHLEDVPRRLRGAKRALSALSDAGVDMVLSGHIHQTFVAPLLQNGSISRGVILHTGTSTSNRGRGPEVGQNTCHWIEVDSREARVTSCRWDSSAGGFVENGHDRYPRGSVERSLGDGSASGEFKELLEESG